MQILFAIILYFFLQHEPLVRVHSPALPVSLHMVQSGFFSHGRCAKNDRHYICNILPCMRRACFCALIHLRNLQQFCMGVCPRIRWFAYSLANLIKISTWHFEAKLHQQARLNPFKSRLASLTVARPLSVFSKYHS